MRVNPSRRALPYSAGAWVLGAAAAEGIFGSTIDITSTAGRWLATAGLVAVAVTALRPPPFARRFGVYVVLPAASFVAGVVSHTSHAPPPLAPEGVYRFHGRVLRVVYLEDSIRNDVEALGGRQLTRSTRRLPPGSRLRLYGARLAPGDRIDVVAHLIPRRPLRNHRNEVGNHRGGWMTGSIDRPGQVISKTSIASTLERFRARVRSTLRSTLSAPSSGFARAILLGDRGAVRRTDQQAVRHAGLAHVLAVSGLHVGLVTALLVVTIREVSRRCAAICARYDSSRVAFASGVGGAFAFAALSGGAPSAWRAAVAAALSCALLAGGRRPDPLSTCAAAVLLLALIPLADTSNVGFFLSVVATAAIVTPPNRSGDSSNGSQGWVTWVTWRAMVATSPIAYQCFRSIPAVGLIANLALVPIVAVLVPLCMAHLVLAETTPWVADATAAVIHWVTAGFLSACRAFAESNVGIGLPPPTPPQVLAALMAALCALASLPHRDRTIGLACSFLLWVGAEIHVRSSGEPELRITFLDIGQGDAALVQLPGGKSWLIDGGGLAHDPATANEDPAARAVANALRTRRISTVDVAIATHAHPDHVGGLISLPPQLRPRELWATRQARAESPAGRFSVYESTIRRVRRPKELCAKGHRDGEVFVRLLWPCPGYDPGLDLNDNSLVVALEHRRRRFLFTGDIEYAAERALLDRHRRTLRADVIKAPHHGSPTSSHDDFLRAVRPRLAILSVGTGNRFGHPDAAVVRRYRKNGARVLRTDLHGAIDVWSGPNGIRFETVAGNGRGRLSNEAR